VNGAGRGLAVDVAIVNWNTSPAALAAARAFVASEDAEARVTIYDNASTDEEREILEREAGPLVNLVLAPRNNGYGAAANAALTGGDAPFVCVSNADVRPEPRMLAALAHASWDPGTGMAGPLFTGGGNRHHARIPSGPVLLARLFAGRVGTRTPPLPQSGETVAVEQPSGACFVTRRDVWEAVGGFDEDFFLWYEDVDLARRLLHSGRRNVVAGAAVAHHQGGSSFAQVPSARAQEIRLNSMQRYVDKHHPRLRRPARPLIAAARRLRAR
jgi:GT2 family glycosyltransferase